MEGIEQNDIVYDFMTETPWYNEPPEMVEWFNHYIHRRYGFQNKLLEQAWQLLRISVYCDPIGIRNHGRYVITSVPQPGLHSQLHYNPQNVTESLKLFAKFINNYNATLFLSSETFVYDLVDLSRQVLQLIFDYYYQKLDQEIIKNNFKQCEQLMAKMTYILELMEKILQSSQHWLLYNWIHDARALGADKMVSKLRLIIRIIRIIIF